MRPANLFCSRCGTAAPDDISATPLGLWEQRSSAMADPDRDRLISDDSSRESPTQSRSQMLMLVLGAVGALALIWLLIRPADEPAIDESAIDESANDESASEEIDEPAIEDIGGSDEGSDDGTAAEADGLPDQGSLPVEALPVGPAFEAEVRYADPRSEPLVGEPTGLGLVSGNLDVGLPLQLLVLDSGERIVLSDIRGVPVAAHGTTLLVQLGDVLSAVDLGQPDPEPVTLVEVRNGSVSVVGFEHGGGEQGETEPVVWTVVAPSEPTLSARLESYSLAGQALDRVDLGPYAFQSGAVDLVYNPAGGIYRRSDDGFVRQSTGRTLAAGEGLVLAHECDDAMVCGPGWFTRASWSRVDLPLPEGLLSKDYLITGGDRWLVTAERREEVATLSDIATGQIAWRWLRPQWDAGTGIGPPVSSDGRWLVDFSSIRPGGGAPISVIADLENNAVWGLDHAFGRSPVATLIDLGGTPYGQVTR